MTLEVPRPPLKGSKASGSMHVVARQSGGVWKFQTIEVEANGKTINVLAGSGNDRFVFGNGAAVSGRIDAGAASTGTISNVIAARSAMM